MKKIIMIIACLMLGGAIFAQSKGELKEQIDALTAELQTLRNNLTNSLQRNRQLESRIIELENMLTSQDNTIATQKTTIANYNEQLAGYAEQLNSYAQQVARLNNEITNLTNLVISDTARRTPMPAVNAPSATSPRERIVIFSNTKNNTFTVPEGKIWIIKGYPLLWVFGKYENARTSLRITRWNSQKIINHAIGGNGFYDHDELIPEKTTIKIQIRTGGEDDSPIFANDAEGYLIIQEYDM